MTKNDTRESEDIKKGIYVRLNPQLEGKTNASFPVDFPGIASLDDVDCQFADDGWINIITGHSLKDVEEFEGIIIPLVKKCEQENADKNDHAFVEAKKAIDNLVDINRRRYLRACLLEDNDQNSANIKQIGSLLSCAQTALYALCAWKG
jgi:hypothetical protein